MRLIDADALFPGKLLVVNLKNPMETAKDLLNRINNAPTGCHTLACIPD